MVVIFEVKVLHVISSLSRSGGGPSRSVQGLVAGLNAAGAETWLLTLNHGDEPWIEGVSRFVNGGMFEEVVRRVEPDIVHLHGLWNMGLHRCAVICRRRKIPYVIAPRGMLEPWSLQQKWLKKRIARWLYQDRDLKCAAALHATAESEAEQFRRLGFRNPVIVSPNGVNVPKNFSRVERVEEEFRRRAEGKVNEWLEGVTEEKFLSVLDSLLDAKLASGEYKFKRDGGREVMREGAIRFFREFARRIVQLSDGRCVYFTPDDRARKRNSNNAFSWAEYAVHAVTSSGRLLEGKDYRERLYNRHKAEGIDALENIIHNEHCMYRLIDAHPENDAVLFVGADSDGARMEVATRLDAFGNANANLAEVTVIAMRKKDNRNPPPKSRPLAEVVETVAKHQAAGFSPSTKADIVAFSDRESKGGSGEKLHRILFVSRMHPKKGVLELVEAWKSVQSSEFRVQNGSGVNSKLQTPNFKLTPWVCELVYTVSGDLESEYEAKVKARVKELGLENQFIFTGTLNDDEKWKAYARADLFVLPTYSENFGIVVAEALWAGVPVITTKGTPWYELEGYTNSKLQTLNSKLKCGRWIDIGVAPVAEALKEMMAMPDEARRQMGERGRKLVEEKYTWDAVVKAMVTGYEEVGMNDGVR